MLSKIINLAIVDNQALFRRPLKSFLCEQGNINIPINVSSIEELLKTLKNFPIDILLADVSFSEADAVRTIKNDYPNIRILAVSGNTDIDLVSTLLDWGIYGYIAKTDEPEDLVRAIESAAQNLIYHNRLFTEALYCNKQNSISDSDSLPTLNDREKTILRLIWMEKSSKEIADELFLGVRSIEKIRQDIKEKIGVKSTVGLLKYAIDHKIIDLNTKLTPSPVV